tara:strand:+ start:1108 stop:1650 length:543 start_codon:yes stop_codon:yes gene_type:complete
MRHQTLTFECEACALATGTVENDVSTDELDTGLPANWVQMFARRVMPNPAYAPPRSADEILNELLESVPPDSREQAAGSLGFAVRQAQAAEVERLEPMYFVDEIELHYCHGCVSAVLPTIAEDAMLDAEWIAKPPPAPVEVAPVPVPVAPVVVAAPAPMPVPAPAPAPVKKAKKAKKAGV